MRMRLLSVLAVAAALMAGSAPAAVDTGSLTAFVKSCASNSKGCHDIVVSAVITARNANYGCIPKDMSDSDADHKVFDWLRAADGNPKYKDQPLSDLLWTGIDEVWPCPKP